MQTGGRLVQYVEGLRGGLAAEFRRQFDALRLAAGKRRRPLPQRHISQAQIHQGVQHRRQFGQIAEKDGGVGDGRFQYLMDVPAPVFDPQYLRVEASAAAVGADDLDIAQEMHPDPFDAGALTALAATTLVVEREQALAQPFLDRRGLFGEKRTDAVEEAGIGCGVAAGSAADGRLVDGDQLADRAGSGCDVGGGFRDQLGQQRRLARAGDSGDYVEGAETEIHIDVAQVVQAGAAHFQQARYRTRLFRRPTAVFAAQESPGAACQQDRVVGVGQQVGGRTGEEHLAALVAGRRADVDQPVGLEHGLPVVFDHDHRVALVHQPSQHCQQPVVVPGMQADGRLVQHVGHVAQTGPDDGRQPDALGFASGQRRSRSIQCQVLQSQFPQQSGAPQNRRSDLFADRRIPRREFHPAEKAVELLDRQRGHRGDSHPGETHGARFLLQTGSRAHRAGSGAGEAQDVLVPVAAEDLLHHRNDAVVEAFLARPGGDAAPFQAGFQGVFAEGDADAAAAVEYDAALFVGQIAPGDVHVEAVGAADLVQHVHRHLRVDDVAAVCGYPQGALAQRAAGIGDQQFGVDGVLDAEAAAGGTSSDAVEREHPARQGRGVRSGARPFAETGVEQPQMVVEFAHGADGRARIAHGGLLVHGDGGAEVVDPLGFGPSHLAQQAAGAGGERLQVAALSLDANGVEGQRRLARAGYSGHHHQLVVGDVQVDVLQVMGGGAADFDCAANGFGGGHFRNSSPAWVSALGGFLQSAPWEAPWPGRSASDRKRIRSSRRGGRAVSAA